MLGCVYVNNTAHSTWNVYVHTLHTRLALNCIWTYYKHRLCHVWNKTIVVAIGVTLTGLKLYIDVKSVGVLWSFAVCSRYASPQAPLHARQNAIECSKLRCNGRSEAVDRIPLENSMHVNKRYGWTMVSKSVAAKNLYK